MNKFPATKKQNKDCGICIYCIKKEHCLYCNCKDCEIADHIWLQTFNGDFK